MIKRADITVDKILADYQLAIDMAKSQSKPTDLVNAATAQAKLVGLLKDRIEAGGPGDFDHMENISDVLEKVAQEIGPEAALALSNAFGLTNNQEESEAQQDEGGDSVDIDSIEPPTDAVN